MRRFTILALVLSGSLPLVPACNGDPVQSERIEELGEEASGVEPGPDHRPGQPCLVCHSEGGTASGKAFAIAGTIYRTDKPDSDGAPDIFVQFIDAKGGAPVEVPQTGPTGNFYVPIQDWPDIAFPVRVALYDDLGGPPIQTMRSLIGREGSCNFCHRRNLASPSKLEIDRSKSSAGQIYLTTGTP